MPSVIVGGTPAAAEDGVSWESTQPSQAMVDLTMLSDSIAALADKAVTAQAEEHKKNRLYESVERAKSRTFDSSEREKTRVHEVAQKLRENI